MTTRRLTFLLLAIAVISAVTSVVYQISEQRRIQRLMGTLGSDDEIAVIDAKNELILSTSNTVMQRLIDALAADRGNERDRVISILVEKGAPAVDPLIKRLETRRSVRQPARQTRLPGFGSWVPSIPGIAPPVQWSQEERFEETRAGAATVLGKIGDPRALPALTAALKDQDLAVVEEAAKALDAIGDPSTLPALVSLAAADKTGYVSYNVVEIIGHFKEKGAPYLVEFLRAKDEDTADAAALILTESGASEAGKIAPLLKDADPLVRARAVRVLAAFGKAEYAAAITAALEDSSDDVRTTAAAAIARVPAAKSESAAAPGSLESTASVLKGAEVASQDSDTLLRLLDDKNPEMRLFAVLGLGRRREGRAVPRLITALQDGSADVREVAIKALGAIGDKQAADPLARVMDNDENDWLRNVAAMSLAALGDSRARRVPFQDTLQSPSTDAVIAEAWNDQATSSILERTALDRFGDDLPAFLTEQIVWPSPEDIKKSGGEPDSEAKASAMKWIRKFVRPEYLPDGLETHLVSMRNVQLIPNYVEAALFGGAMEADSGKNPADNLQQRIWCTANMVRFKKGDYVIQIMETPYDVIIVVGSEEAAAAALEPDKLAAGVAKVLLRDQISRAAAEIYAEQSIGAGDARLGMQIPLPFGGSLDRKADAKLHMTSLHLASVGTHGMLADGDGRFVRIDIEKVDLRGMGYFECKQYERAPLEELPPLAP